MIKSQAGFILIIVLVFLFVITLFSVSGSEKIIMDYKMQAQMQRELKLFLRAEAGRRQVIFQLKGQPIALPDSPVMLKTVVKNVSTDACGNETVAIQSTASFSTDRVILNSEDIFAKVPTALGCRTIPLHQCLWWSVN